jgi:integrase/recombinase XerD
MRTLAIATPEKLRHADRKAVIAWERFMREFERAASSTIRRRLAALSSLYKHLVRHGHAARNGHRDPSTTKLYDRRGYNPDKAASLFATY